MRKGKKKNCAEKKKERGNSEEYISTYDMNYRFYSRGVSI